ncbi:MAG: PilZ domain-containing protein [Acidobacteria bacterium]|nr:PilZ domain-containing protein [Acidobacteriota bacterium]
MRGRRSAVDAPEERRDCFERRRRVRFNISVPVRLSRVETVPVSLPGRTVNVSSSGLLLATGAQLEVGSGVEFEVELFSDDRAGVMVWLKCRGVVVRSGREEAASEARAGLRLVEYEFVRQQLGGRHQIRI